LNVTEATYTDYINENFTFGYDIMEDEGRWLLYDGFLIMFLVKKFLFTAMTLSCPTPGGIFTPTFAIGAVLG
jgi:H+/Cl- antiporter ClcA